MSLPAGATEVDIEIIDESLEVTLKSDGKAYETGTRVVAIRTLAGVAQAALALPVHPFTEYTSVRGKLLQPDGAEVEVKPSQIVERPQVSGSALVRETRLLEVSYPGAIVGSKLHLSWNRRLDAALYAQDWVFRGTLPIRRSVYRVRTPAGYHVQFQVHNGAIEPAVTHDQDGVLHSFEVTDAAPLPEEPFAPDLNLVLGTVELYLPELKYDAVEVALDDWGDIASFYDRLADGQYGISDELATELRRDAKKLGESSAVIDHVYRLLRPYRYLQVYLGAGGYRPHAAMWTQRRRFGDCKDLSTLLVAMLRAAGVKAYPMLTRVGRGHSIESARPSPRQFNHCVTYVPRKEGGLILDATAPTYPVGFVPTALAGSPGLVVYGKNKHELLTVPHEPAASNALDVELTLDMDTHGGLRGELVATLTGDYLALGRILDGRALTELDAGRVGFLLPMARSSARLTGMRYDDQDRRLVVRADYHDPLAVGHLRGQPYVGPAVLITDARTSAFAAEERELPVDLGAPEQVDLRLRFRNARGGSRGDGACPAAIELNTPFGSYRLECSVEDRDVVFDRHLMVAQAWIPPADYDEARAFWRSVADGDRSATLAARKD